ncbi:adenosylcobinamide-phosphate synthase CbiB [Lachnospiraceae bacterium NSJ-143]|nr:adenosylcobinamide-phosphate synthase CbiB [Lachnospiraceae bacterium NSJ-143]
MDEITAAIVIGFIIDLIVGDPHNIPHPVVFIGRLIDCCEKSVRKVFSNTDRGLFWGGMVLCFVVMSISAIIPLCVLILLGRINFYLKFAVECIMCWQIIAVKSLKTESTKVFYELENNSIDSARQAVSMIVGRDTENLNDAAVTRAAVETVAESTSDGIVAPLFFMMLGGPVLGFLYKSVNTMDSMIGYKNDKYMFLGRAAAKTDDFFNFIPARISGALMIAASFILGYNYKNAVRIFLRDRLKHKSPNSAHTESACAGALGVMLAGDAWYFGKLVKKQTIGDNLKEMEHSDIIKANRLMYTTSFLALILAAAARMAVNLI